MIKLFNISVLLLIFFIIAVIIFINYSDYQNTLNYIAFLTNNENRIIKLQNIITQKKLYTLNYLLIFYLFVFVSIYLFKKKILNYLSFFLINLKTTVFNIFFNFKNTIPILFIVIFPSTVLKLYFLISLPGTYDEIFTIINFTSKGFFASLAYYPAPNNHVLFSVIASILNFIMINDLFINRFLSFISGILFICILFFTIAKEFNTKTSIFVTILISSLFPIISYGYLGRGYGFIILFAYISFFSVYKILFSDNKKINYYLFIISIMIILALCTNPSALYFFVTIFVTLFLNFLVKKQFVTIFNLISYGIFICVCVLIFYSPIIFFSGVDSLIGNKFVESSTYISPKEYINYYFLKLPSYLFNNFMLFYIFIILGIFNLILNKSNFVFFIFIFFSLIFSLMAIIIHNIIPPERIFVFLIPPYIFLLSKIFDDIKNTYLNYFTTIFFIFSSIFIFYDSFQKITQHHFIGKIGKESANFIINEKPNRIYLRHGLLDAFLIYYGNNKLNIKYDNNKIYDDNSDNKYDYFVLNINNDSKNLLPIKAYIMDQSKPIYNINIYKNLNYEK